MGHIEQNWQDTTDGDGAKRDTNIQAHKALTAAAAYGFKCDKNVQVPHYIHVGRKNTHQGYTIMAI